MKKNVLAADNQQSVEVVNGGNSQVVTRKASKKKEPFHAVREKAANLYRKQLNRGVDTMKKAIEYALNQASIEYDQNRFLADYGRLVESVWELEEPFLVTNARTLLLSICTVSLGARSSATIIDGSAASISPSSCPDNTRTRRSEISFTSAALAFM